MTRKEKKQAWRRLLMEHRDANTERGDDPPEAEAIRDARRWWAARPPWEGCAAEALWWAAHFRREGDLDRAWGNLTCVNYDGGSYFPPPSLP